MPSLSKILQLLLYDFKKQNLKHFNQKLGMSLMFKFTAGQIPTKNAKLRPDLILATPS